MKSFEQFEKDYRRTGFLDMGTCTRRPSKPLNDNQLQTAYKQYQHKVEVQKTKAASTSKGPSQDALVRMEIEARDGGRCRLLTILTRSEQQTLYENSAGIHKTLDAAHVFGKNAYPWMRFDPRNVMLLNRFSHNMLDTGKSPITGKMISADEHDYWWERIVGHDEWEYLLDQSVRR